MIVGLGNPGAQYQNNRHNIGFRALELYAEKQRIEVPRMQLKAKIGDGWIRKPQGAEAAAGSGSSGVSRLTALLNPVRQKVLLVKPMTYMNNSGEAVASLANYYKIEPEEILVIHDDLDLPTAKIRLRPGGGSGGQNGIKSITQKLGTPDYARMRIGIDRPPGKMKAAAYVLQDFLHKEAELFAPLNTTICQAIDTWLFEGIERAMNRFN